ncbi:hypothetical protein [uncultured Chryseobacterium sp.]|jgi:hypothetical protein|uniref:hypothetical protein n=1 Tax=uncultured Chryseobacterium sp. TaxID=259322 RepID=UPI002604CA45|nr:hypothetical protein [uncultured Chryseobacterium sp.]
MNSNEITKLVEYYEDKILTNFDTNFNELVLMDFYEGGFEDRIEDEFFYKEYFLRYEQGIIDLLLSIEDKFDETTQNLKLRLIKLKRIIDNKLAKSIKVDENKDFRVKRKSQFLLSQTIDKEEFVALLYSKLTDNKLIDIGINDFKKHFTLDWDSKIQWLGTELQLTNLIFLLIKDKYLESETETFKHKLVCTHFINKRGNEFSEKQLGGVFSEKKNTIANDDVIFKIMYEMSSKL